MQGPPGWLAVWAAAALVLARPAAAAADLTGLSLEDLMQIPVTVTSAAKKPQDIQDVAAAVFVLTGDDIRRSGATSVPDALRFVPGLDVYQVDANSWAISARGFTSSFANKLLVMIDGRSIYSPIFSGVFWELQTVLLDDIDRIEVIRGPGAALWGRQRGQRGHQHHHQGRRLHPGDAGGEPRRGHAGRGQRCRALWRHVRRFRVLPASTPNWRGTAPISAKTAAGRPTIS